jgi:hypothetical protein
MHIELTDHLRCPQLHPEAFLVLLPDRMKGRHVVAGHLGCPVCGWNTAWSDGIPVFGAGQRATDPPPCDAAAAVALLGLAGPGGWLALGGSAGAMAPELALRLPGIHLVAVNPPADVESTELLSLIISEVWPLKAHALRGVVLGGETIDWRDDAILSVLPGLRAVGIGEPPPVSAGTELLGSADGLWVVRRR